MTPQQQDAGRNVPNDATLDRLLTTFDALEPGRALVIVGEENQKRALALLQAKRPGAFDWNVLEAGPERFRVEIVRRSTAAPRAVAECLGTDHRRLDAICADVARLVAAAAYEDADPRFAEFVCGMSRHIAIEENVIFPAFERATGMANGPTAVMRHEHTEIRGQLDRATDAIARRDADAFRTAIELLSGILERHNMKEERILYPMTDRSVGGEPERDALVRKMQAY